MLTFFQLLGILNVLAGAYLVAPGFCLIVLGVLIIWATIAYEQRANTSAETA